MPIRPRSPITDSARAPRPIRNSIATCFSDKGDSFDPDIVTAASQPMVCGRSAGEYRAYLPRARWIRDANDSYFAAMTYPQGLPSAMQPADIHDATWGDSVGGLWRRDPSHRRRPCRDGGRGIAGRCRGAASRCRRCPEVDRRSRPPPRQRSRMPHVAMTSVQRSTRPSSADVGAARQCAGLRPSWPRPAASSPRPAPADISPRWRDRPGPSRYPAADTRSHPCRAAKCPNSRASSASGRRGSRSSWRGRSCRRADRARCRPRTSSPSRFMSRIKEMPSTGAFLRSSVHFVQISLASSPARKRLGDHAFEDAAL